MNSTSSEAISRQHPLPLRPWQAACLQQALQSLTPQTPHFLCQATPGAGKMMLAAVLADELMSRGDIDFVLYLGPTRAVVARAVETLCEVTGLPMHGRLGAAGGAYTYHALNHRLQELKALCQQARVMLIWDESHHAAGRGEDEQDTSNRWGLALLALERHVQYTLALSGTPWRTDGSCLPLLRYVESTQGKPQAHPLPADGESSDEADLTHALVPDFVYSLTEAIRDQVCRLPRLQLIDNPAIQLTAYHPRSGRQETHHYSSIPHLLRHPTMQYSQLLRHSEPMTHLLERSCQQLRALRQQDPDAAGLVVASDIAHAEEIAEYLEDRGETVCLVTSRSPGAHERLSHFRDTKTPWLVAVGMVSEGVDIPRLRVCCYLSHIRTEQRFRQVLGRIIRREGIEDAECYLFALNEPSLRHFARRITDDLPDDLAHVQLASPSSSKPAADIPGNAGDPASGNGGASDLDAQSAQDPGLNPARIPSPHLSLNALPTLGLQVAPDVEFSNQFITRLIALQLSHS
ncbi:DEAD/DEAH box helicase family protein [Billgrantia diversa]|uniref:DEAD/DEAH box helicase n=1 Tax=Halomonas sp. MCCC 1A13316 TaxID=2733487 RepID=UPI0018A48C8B|nr:DEAD/DEAH box helicase family protein [Halomonas sp. MCCC 1A13316]QOR39060.1 DEAD/DEAH box helicase family protein [Halomonas sp. MCCC 1A13316]